MDKTFYKVKLKTGGKTLEQIRKDFEGYEPSEKDIKSWQTAYNLIDGLVIIVMDSWSGDGYCLVSWQEKDEDTFKKFIYQIEQDSMFGSYVDEWEEFIKDWEADEYSPSGSIVFSENDVEIIEELKKKQAK